MNRQLLLILALLPLPALAALGGDESTVQGDRLHMKVQAHTAQAGGGYTVHDMTDQHGVQVKEYVSLADKVFAVSWNGPAKPDLQQLLGSYFDQYLQRTAGKHGRMPLAVNDSDLVVVSGGHMRAFHGKAWVPALVPASVDINSLP